MFDSSIYIAFTCCCNFVTADAHAYARIAMWDAANGTVMINLWIRKSTSRARRARPRRQSTAVADR